MIGSYRMMDWERDHLSRVLKTVIEKLKNGSVEESLTGEDICPANIDTILTEHLGYEWVDENENRHDFWYIWHHPNDPDNLYLYLYINVDTFEMKLFFEEDED